MIRILSHEPAHQTPPQVETDYHIPLDVNLPRAPGEVPSYRRTVPIYWRTGDFHHSLVEMGLDPESGRLVSVTVTLVHAEHTSEGAAAPAAQPSAEGCPNFDISLLQGAYTDDPGTVLLHLGPDFVWLSFTQDRSHLRELRYDRLRFLIGDDDAWLGLVVEDLTAEQLAELRAGIPRA